MLISASRRSSTWPAKPDVAGKILDLFGIHRGVVLSWIADIDTDEDKIEG